MTTLTTTGTIDTLLFTHMDTFGNAESDLTNYFGLTFNGIDFLNASTTFVQSSVVTSTSTNVTGYDPADGGELNLLGQNLLFNHGVNTSGTFTGGSYQSGGDPGAGAFTPDGTGSWSMNGNVKWTYDHVNGGNLTGGLTSLTVTHSTLFGTENLTFTGSNIHPDDLNELHGLATKEVITTDANISVTLTSTAGIDISDGSGTLSSITFDDHLGDKIVLTGAMDSDHFRNGSFNSIADYLQDSTVMAGADAITLGASSTFEWHGYNGADKLTGASGADTLSGDDGNDTLTGNAGDDFLQGGNGNDILLGGDGNDVLIGGSGVNTMTGGLGNDTYYVDNATDKVTEAAGGGHDNVISTVSFTLAANVEDLALAGGNDINATGNTLANDIGGNSGANIIDGVANTDGSGDSLTGGDGNDTYILHNALDAVFENTNEGNDTVVIAYNTLVSNTDISLSDPRFANIENITITGTGAYQIHGDANDNILIGNASNNSMFGGGGNDTFDGGGGADFMDGGAGNDTYIVDNIGDQVFDGGGSNTIDDKMASGTFTLAAGQGFDILNLQGAGALNAVGNGEGDTITGNAAANVIESGVSVNANIATLAGGAGNDTYIVDNTNDVIIEGASAGTDLVQANASYILSANIENLTLAAGAVNGTGNAGNNVITGNAAANFLDGAGGNDTIIGGDGNDLLVGHAGNCVLNGGNGDDYYSVDVTAVGGLGHISSTITDASGNDTLVLMTAAPLGLTSAFTVTLQASLENMDATGTGDDLINLKGNTSVNVLTGNAGDNTLDGVANTGGAGDTLAGWDGNDTYILHSANDVVIEALAAGNDTIIVAYNALVSHTTVTLHSNPSLANVENITVTGTGLFDIIGNTDDNILIGNASVNTLFGFGGNDTLDGGAGADLMVGGTGNDVFTIDNVNDSVDTGGGGSDTVIDKLTSGTFTMASGIDTLIMMGTGALHAIGNGEGDLIVGNAGANVLDAGSAFSDSISTLQGGLGNDTYFVDNVSDLVQESTLVNEGTDLIMVGFTYNLNLNGGMAFVENVTLTGNLNASLFGNTINNVLTGNTGDNTLQGLGGVDTLIGGLGNDTYIVDAVLSGTAIKVQDIVTDTGGTNDTLALTTSASLTPATATTLTLAATLENFDISGTHASHINITGNASDNVLTGNDWDNTIDGGTGADSMDGGNGSDTYIVNTVLDSVNDSGSGIGDLDTVILKYNVTAPTEVQVSSFGGIENLTAGGTGFFNLTGDSHDNVLTGNASINTLTGGDGNDTYVVSTGDVVVEAATPGAGDFDTVKASVNWTLSDNVEILFLTGTAKIGTGNALDNFLLGNAGANTLTGGGGNDSYDGGAGADRLVGGAGSDDYFYNHDQVLSAANADTIVNFDTTNGPTGDRIDISDVLVGYTSGTLTDYLHVTQSGLNTVLSVDPDGTANGVHFVTMATLLNVTASSLGTADDMLANGHLGIIPG